VQVASALSAEYIW